MHRISRDGRSSGMARRSCNATPTYLAHWAIRSRLALGGGRYGPQSGDAEYLVDWSPGYSMVEVNPARLSGTPTMKGSRMPAPGIFDHMSGYTPDEIAELFGLSLEPGSTDKFDPPHDAVVQDFPEGIASSCGLHTNVDDGVRNRWKAFERLPQLQRRQRKQREHQRQDPEAGDHLRLGPSSQLEVVMQRSHAEDAFATP